MTNRLKQNTIIRDIYFLLRNIMAYFTRKPKLAQHTEDVILTPLYTYITTIMYI